ncbi:MAG: hypothetical protein U1E43_01180 [Rhodospirillales bacterium]
MTSPDPDVQALHGLLCRHQWTDVADWGRAIAALADLSEPDIDRLVVAGGDDCAKGADSPLPAAAAVSG